MNKLNAFDLRLAGLSLSKQLHQYRIDSLIVVGLAIAIAVSTYLGTYQIPDPLFTDFYAQDIWFGSDIPTVFGNITSLNSDFGRNNKHPLFPLVVFPLVYGIGKLLHLEPISAVRILIVVVAILWISSLYALFRIMGCQRLDATLLSLLGGVSAASMFWLVTPESFPFGSLTILLGLSFATLTQYRPFSGIWYIAVNLITVSITITNSMVGIFVTLINHRWVKALQLGIISLLVATGLWILQRIVFKNSGFPFQPGTFIGEKKFIADPDHSNILAAVMSFFYQTMVMPTTQFLNSPIRPDWVKLDTNALAPASGGVWGTIAVVAWTGLLCLGLWSFFTIKRHPKLRIVLGLTLIVQLLLHSIYGVEETFIYSLHFLPLLLTLVTFSFLTRLRLLSLALVSILIISAGINNRTQFNSITATLWNYGTPHQQVEAQMKRRPGDPWMRSAGHVILATPASLVENKAFYEPGGSFSPKPGSFGLSIWVVDRQGTIKATSDNIPLSDIQQKFMGSSGQNPPGISTKTAYYQADWSTIKPDRWQLDLKTVKSDLRPVVVIRSVGPAGGAVRSLDWDGQRLRISDRWAIKNLPNSATVYLGDERSPGWTRQKSTAAQWKDERGWGYARLELGQGNTWNLEIEDLFPGSEPDAIIANTPSTLTSSVPNAQFVDSFNAQIGHLMAGLVGNQTRPGDPIDYPLPRFRDGAYQMVALARTGHLKLAQQLAPYFAATDFMNGTRPEADIPAVGIWALAAVAEQVNQPAFDQFLWADVRRKAELIIDLISSNRPGYPVIQGTERSFSEYPDFIRTDVIAGKMDASPGLIALDPTANLMSYRALLDAATFADRMKRPDKATRWRSQAAQLQTAWQQAFDLRFAGMDATYTNGLWPSWIATAKQNAFVQGLEKRWVAAHDDKGNLRQLPENTNFNLAETHQWLYLDQPDRVWATLRWFWNHQASPGLYTWWGKNDDPSGVRLPASLSQWNRFRGWVNPPHVTPYYWTAAEMLLLQLDMLAYAKPMTDTPTLVIGAGVPQEWLSQPLMVKGLLVGSNGVNWTWDGKQVNVQIRGKKMNVQLGKAFPQNTPIVVTESDSV